jgi:hypothetical protein
MAKGGGLASRLMPVADPMDEAKGCYGESMCTVP